MNEPTGFPDAQVVQKSPACDSRDPLLGVTLVRRLADDINLSLAQERLSLACGLSHAASGVVPPRGIGQRHQTALRVFKVSARAGYASTADES